MSAARLASRCEDLKRREAVAKKLHEQLTTIQRDTLEMRLAVEELWSKISSQTPPAKVTQDPRPDPARLAEVHRAERDELGRRRAELEEISTRLDQEQARLQRRHAELERWLAAKNTQIEADADHLMAREKELDQQQTGLAHVERAWAQRDAQRRGEIRRLLALLRQSDAKDAA